MERISILDGLRLFAVTLVMFHHYRFGENLPVMKELVEYGYMGVPIFFIISGFVIYFSLEKTKNYSEFLKKRYIRLAPAMLICSLLTFSFFKFVYTGNNYLFSKDPHNLLIANTFIDPHFFDLFVGHIKYYYLDGSYWSLWVEVNFYLIIGWLYFRSRQKMIRNYILICAVGIPFYVLLTTNIGNQIMGKFFSSDAVKYLDMLGRTFAFFHECLWFLIGLFLYELYKDKKATKYVLYIAITTLFLLLWERGAVYPSISILIIVSLYLIFIYKPQYLSFLASKHIAKIGVASYSIYLIHSYVGNGIMEQLKLSFGIEFFFMPVAMMILVCLFALFSYKYLETPLSNLLKKLLLRKTNSKK